MKKLLRYLKPHKLAICINLFFKIIGTVMELVIPFILAYVIDTVISKNRMDLIIYWSAFMIICSIICVSFNIIANRMSAKIAMNVTKKLRHDLFVKIEDLSQKQVDKITIQSLVSRMTTDTYNFNQMVLLFLRLGVRTPILITGGIVFSLFLDSVLTLVLLTIMPIIAIIIIIISKKGIPLFNNLQQSNDNLVSIVREDVNGIRLIKALDKEEYEKNRFNDVNIDVSNKDIKAQLSLSLINPLMNLILDLGLVGAIIVGALRVKEGLTKPGSIIAFMTYFAIISGAMISLTRLFIVGSKAVASSKRINEVFNLTNDLLCEDDNTTSDAFIEFRNVSFGYNNNLVLKNISFKINKGESLGIIGQTGSGKTTIINLLMRFYDPTEGQIYVLGKNIKSIPIKELRDLFGVVFQNDSLFFQSIKDNIDFGRGLSVDEVNSSISDALAKDFVNSLEEGIETSLSSKGNNLSGGQKQRLLIARALANNPKILILDDSSSALDYKTDQMLRENLEKYQSTSIIVAQRISSIKDCNKIIVLENGIIDGIGTNDELLISNQTYKAIKASQMGGDFDAI